MAINPETNKIEALEELMGELYRPDGSKVPKHWATFQVGEQVVIKDYTFKVAYIGESAILFEPVAVAALNVPQCELTHKERDERLMLEEQLKGLGKI